MKTSEIVNTLETAVAITREGGQGSRRRVSEMLTELSTQLIREAPQAQLNICAYYRKGSPSTIYIVDDNNWLTYGFEPIPLEIARLVWETENALLPGRERPEGFPLFEFHVPFESRVSLFPESEVGQTCSCGHQYAFHAENSQAGCDSCVCGGAWTPRRAAGFREHPALGLVGETLVQNEGDGWEACGWTHNRFYAGHAKFNNSEVVELRPEEYDIYGDADGHLPLRVYDRKRKVVIGLIGPRIARALGREIHPYSSAPTPLDALQAKVDRQRNAD